MSNYAPDPKKEQVYDNLQNFTLENVTALDIERLTNPTKIQATNQDALLTYNIVNKAAMRDGSPMPNGGGIAQYIQTGDSDYQDIKPPTGEVWQIMSFSVQNDPSVTGSNTYFTYWAGPNITGLTNAVYHSAIASSSNAVPAESLFEENFHPIYVSNKAWLRVYSNMDNVGTGARVIWNVAYQNIR